MEGGEKPRLFSRLTSFDVQTICKKNAAPAGGAAAAAPEGGALAGP
jgi:hypothetical protein